MANYNYQWFYLFIICHVQSYVWVFHVLRAWSELLLYHVPSVMHLLTKYPQIKKQNCQSGVQQQNNSLFKLFPISRQLFQVLKAQPLQLNLDVYQNSLEIYLHIAQCTIYILRTESRKVYFIDWQSRISKILLCVWVLNSYAQHVILATSEPVILCVRHQFFQVEVHHFLSQKMLAARSIAQSTRNGSLVSFHHCSPVTLLSPSQVLRHYSAAATAGFAGRKGSNVGTMDVLLNSPKFMIYIVGQIYRDFDTW